MRFLRLLALGLVLMVPVLALGAKKPPEPPVVKVQHILVAFKGSVPSKTIERTKAEAQALADELLERARGGEEFDALVKEYTADKYPGIYVLTNTGAPRRSGAQMREQMVPGFGDVAFRLAVGEIGMAQHHGVNSPFGWHVIKRLE
jgi:parvulin-like peptidyl-prolyl isomerase